MYIYVQYEVLMIMSRERNLPTLSCLTGEDIDDIWARVACFIERQMITRKGVCISGLGTFTFSFDKLTPIFILTEKLCRIYGFKQKKRQCSEDVPVASLNFSSLSADSPYERDCVEGCVRETILLLLRAASSLQSVARTFPRIGVLTFQQTRVKMIFYRDFISALDAAGKLSLASTSRAGSHSSERQKNITRPATTNARTSAKHPARKDLKTEPSSAQRQPDEEDGRASRGSADGEIVTSNTDRVVKLSQPAGDTMNAMTVKSDAGVNETCADHRRAGQELCYVCMQRARRNIPLYVPDDERKRAEQEQERVLMLNQHQKDLQYFQKQEADRMKKREDGRQIAAFNLALAEVQRRRRTFNQSHGSYIFASHLCTPDHRLQQRDPVTLAEQRLPAHKISEELRNISRARDHQLKSLNDQKREREIIQTNHQEMSEERIRHYEKVRNLQVACEKNWKHRVSLRRQRDREDLQDFRRFGCQNITDQLEKYERCNRCKRSTANRGQSNLFRDTNYLSGSRLML
ncbi:coiled-coil domain-containing protein 81-like isoform X2 [Triplophysa rosa]|uniref:coiled-coil domain-containing protein 81-like isoform X2 n=1 Tax=Triplophysa rosa TaxID=992332 RepID=UPI0025462DF2|nr:coiled-coil domain-containing protein 81-like isoform X2 [Triplophysa rosa]